MLDTNKPLLPHISRANLSRRTFSRTSSKKSSSSSSSDNKPDLSKSNTESAHTTQSQFVAKPEEFVPSNGNSEAATMPTKSYDTFEARFIEDSNIPDGTKVGRNVLLVKVSLDFPKASRHVFYVAHCRHTIISLGE